MTTPITYYGGKQQLSARIIGMMPSHRIYCEPFFGGGAVFFAKAKSELEVINDTNDRLITFYQICQTRFDDLRQLIKDTLCSESMFRYAKDIYNHRIEADDLGMAWAIWTIANGAFGASIHGGWKWCNGTHGAHMGVVMQNKRNAFTERIRDRLATVQISCKDALEVIRKRDSAETFFYLDPPYPGFVQGHYRGYTMREFAELLELLQNLKGRFILSNYWSQTLRYYVGRNRWNIERITMPLKVANGLQRQQKTEILVSNYTPAPTLF